MTEVALHIGGEVYKGWKTVGINRAMDAVASAFRVELSEKWEDGADVWPIDEGDEVTVKADGITMLSGYVDSVSPRFDGGSHSLSVSGRSRSGDLVDCAAPTEPGKWKNVGFRKLVAQLAAPYGITAVADETSGRTIELAKTQVGETVWEFIERLARREGLLVNDDYDGGLVIREPTTSQRAKVALVQGKNITAANGSRDWSGRFSEYTVKAQLFGGDLLGAEASALVKGRAVDENITRYRPKVVVAESASNAKQANDRAAFEMSVAAGKSASAQITVPGWFQNPEDDDPTLWEPNLLVSIDSPWLRMDGRDMLISRVSFQKGEGGEKTTLEVAPVEAFRVLPKLVQGDGWSALLSKLGVS